MWLLIISILAFVLSAQSCHKDANFVNAEAKRNLVYGPNQRNLLDVYLPFNRDSNTYTVMLIHGGGWVAGDKKDWSADIINAMVQKGYAVACINYRYGCGDFHKQMDDIQMALDYLDANATTWNTASHKFGLVGASAGGHMALLFAHAYDTAHQVKAAVSLVGPTDLTDTLFHQYAANYSLTYIFQQFLGADFQSNPQVYRDASPLFHCGTVPTLFMHGANDNLVPPAQGIRMFDSLTVHGVPADTTFFGNAGHDLFGPKGVNQPQVLGEIGNWMQLYLH